MNRITKLGTFLTLAVGLQSTAFALEVGDDAPCVVLQQQLADGTELEGCIRDQLQPETQSFTLIDFASIHCSICESNLPALSQLATDIAATTTTRKVTIDRSKADVQEYIEKHKEHFNYPVAFDVGHDAKDSYEVKSTPTTFILDEQYKIVYKHKGLLTDEAIQEIKELVGVAK